jgi:DNA-binding MarR family transcriptional regulator
MAGKDARAAKENQLNEDGFLASSGYLLARIGSESRRRWRYMLADHDLGEHAFGVLMALDAAQPQSQHGLSQVLGIDPRNAVAVLDGLERRTLIERAMDPADRRRHAVRLTANGRVLLERLRTDGAATELAMLDGLTARERADLHRLLVKLLGSMTALEPFARDAPSQGR